MSRIRDYADPRKPAGFYVGPHLILFLVLIASYAIGAATGAFVAHRLDGHYFQQHYQADVHVPPPAAPLTNVAPMTTPAVSINIARYPGIGDQGTEGACAAWASAWSLSYLYRQLHPTSWLRFAPAWLYNHFSCTYSGGQDAGSWPDQDLELVPTEGAIRFKYEPSPPFTIDCNDRIRLMQIAQKIRLPITVLPVGNDAQGQGPGFIALIKAALARNHPVMFGFPVWPEYDGSTGEVTSPTPLEVQQQPQGRGGHENVILACDDAHRFSDGETGGCLLQNQWSTRWGQQGRAWATYSFLETYGFGGREIALTSGLPSAAKPPTFVPANAPTHAAPPVTGLPHMVTGTTRQWVHGIVLADTDQDVSRIINYWAWYYGVSARGLAATGGVESGWRAVNDSPRAYDLSWGFAQFTPSTACGYSICGSYAYIKSQLDQPRIAIRLMARYYHDALAYHAGRVPFPYAYGLFNQGYGLPDASYFYPQGQAYLNYQNFISWWNLVGYSHLGLR